MIRIQNSVTGFSWSPFASALMASSLHPPALLPPLCCSSHALLDHRTRGRLPPRLSNGTCSTARPSGRSDFFGKGGALASRPVARRSGTAGAGRGPFFGGGGGRRVDRGMSRVVGNLAFAALLTYLAVTGQLRWVLDAIVSLWLLTILLPILAVGALFFFAGQNILQGDCPNCGKKFRILKSALKDGPQLCPYCTQPFSVQGNKFVRESTRYSSGRAATATDARVFNELFTRVSNGKAPSGTIVDVEAEVKDAE